MSSIVDTLKEKLTTGDSKPGGNPQAGGAVTDPRGHDASKLPFSTKQGQNQQEFPGEVQGQSLTRGCDVDLTDAVLLGKQCCNALGESSNFIDFVRHPYIATMAQIYFALGMCLNSCMWVWPLPRVLQLMTP